ncbi:hypothetical protein X762_14650 [Mesorhizobium sp. LSHC426A00]|nr:hypothetical protein X762_14650 [Mesorhizobium sp. LSHC426A00]ESX53839.1 hypothetical protein X761_18995 [Mesorhizobium sp. LSHC424B00]ESX74055.1 hypothetical protein X758_08120 [Mesorhizobium sp. LSHC416B00]
MTHQTMEDTIAVVEIGGTSVKVGFADHGIPVDFARTYPTAQLRQGAPVAGLADAVTAACRDAGLKPARVVATVPGFIDRDFDTVLHTANIPELNGIRLGTELASRLRVPVRLERDVVLQLLGESVAGAVKRQKEVLAVYLGTGIGAAYLGKDGIFRGGGWALESAICRSTGLTKADRQTASRPTPQGQRLSNSRQTTISRLPSCFRRPGSRRRCANGSMRSSGSRR